ncbi:MAG TPA: hypothetical protein VFP33_03840 [Gallionella sp.]|nr:hypothetical protein [Gallionella sp.]
MRVTLQRIAIAYLVLFSNVCFADDAKKLLSFYVETTTPTRWQDHTKPENIFKEEWWRINALARAMNVAAGPFCGKYRDPSDTNGYSDAYRIEQSGKMSSVSQMAWISPLGGGELQVGDQSVREGNLRAEAKALPGVSEALEKKRKDKNLLLVYRDGNILAVSPPQRQSGSCSFFMQLVEPGFLQSGKSLARYRTTVGGREGNTYFQSVFEAFPEEKHLQWFIAHELATAIIPAQFGTQAGDLYERFNAEINNVFTRWVAKLEGTPEQKDFHKEVNIGPYIADYLSVYIGENAGYSIEDFMVYLEKHRQYSIANEYGRPASPVAKQFRERLIRYWYQEMLATKKVNEPVVPDPEKTIRDMEALQ